jgi:hypothetical protein
MKALEVTEIFSLSLMDTEQSSFLIGTETRTVFCFFEVFGLIFSVYSFLLAAVWSKLLSEVKRWGPCFFPCSVGSFSGLNFAKGDVLLHEDPTDNGPRLKETVRSSVEN